MPFLIAVLHPWRLYLPSRGAGWLRGRDFNGGLLRRRFRSSALVSGFSVLRRRFVSDFGVGVALLLDLVGLQRGPVAGRELDSHIAEDGSDERDRVQRQHH